MVSKITALTGSGLKDWFVQRLSALVLLAYIIFCVAFIASHPHMDFLTWQQLFHCTAMKVFTLLALLSLLAHAWVGIWTIFTDYITCSIGRAILQTAVVIIFIACLIWGITILWS